MKLVLNGGGVGEAVASARQLLNGLIDHTKKILYVPLAWPDPTFEGCLEFMTQELSDVEKAGIDMIKTPEELMEKDFKEYACLYVGGGNTYKLLNDLKGSGAFGKMRKYLLEEDGIVYGGSAGIPEEDTIFVDDGKIKIMGSRPYSEFVDGREIVKSL